MTRHHGGFTYSRFVRVIARSCISLVVTLHYVDRRPLSYKGRQFMPSFSSPWPRALFPLRRSVRAWSSAVPVYQPVRVPIIAVALVAWRRAPTCVVPSIFKRLQRPGRCGWKR
ncbi:hypothetical protein B0H19DRAFT_1124805 [Mycena capillaripes]|nr:hypothetical protein B0H19DRAFT_1124805 [Mycena capillaripes]